MPNRAYWNLSAGALGWAVWLLSTGIVTAAGFIIATHPLNFYALWPDYYDLLLALSFLPLGAVGALVAARRPASIVGWLFCFADLAWSLSLAGRVYVGYVLPGRDLASAAAVGAAELGVLAVACSLLVFPEDRLQAVARRPVAWLVAAAVGGYSLTQVLNSGPLLLLLWHVGVNIPVGVSGRAGEVFYHFMELPAGEAIVIAIFGLAALSVLLRLRRARGVERLQIKWFAFAAILPATGLADMVLYDWGAGSLLAGAGVSALAVAVGIAILRYRLYDIDLIINRTLVYGSVTAVLAGLFAALSILTQRLVLAFTGQESQGAVVLAALVVTALFQPLRARVQIVVDRRFYRRKYNATQTLERFAGQVRDEVELDQLTARLVAVVRETMQPSHASLWLQPSKDHKPSVDRP